MGLRTNRLLLRSGIPHGRLGQKDWRSEVSRLISSRALDRVGWLMAAVALAIMIARTLHHSNNRDFAYIYVAGRAWWAAGDPYGAAFQQIMRAEFFSSGSWPEGWPPPEVWVYPFQWFVVAVPLGLLPFAVAAEAWKTIIGLSTVCATALIWRSADSVRPAPSVLLKGAFALVVATSSAAHTNYALGQTGTILFLGFACTLSGISRNSRWILALGITVLLLKPQLGLSVLLMSLAGPRYRPAVVASAVATILLMIPALLATDPIGQAGSYVQNLSAYVRSPANGPRALAGLGQLLSYLRIGPVPAPLYSVLGGIVGALTLRVMRARRYDELFSYWCASLVVFIVVPKHGSDMFPLFSAMLLIGRLDMVGALLDIGSVAVMFRPYSLFGFAAAGAQNNEWVAQYEGLGCVLMLFALSRISPVPNLTQQRRRSAGAGFLRLR